MVLLSKSEFWGMIYMFFQNVIDYNVAVISYGQADEEMSVFSDSLKGILEIYF